MKKSDRVVFRARVIMRGKWGRARIKAQPTEEVLVLGGQLTLKVRQVEREMKSETDAPTPVGGSSVYWYLVG